MVGGLVSFLLASPPRAHDAHAQDRGSAARLRPADHDTRLPSLDDDELTPEERVAVAVYEQTNMSVVNINTKSVRPDTFFLFDIRSEGSGSGMVLDYDGHILTNYHVIEGAREIHVTLVDGQSYEAALVGHDSITEIAVVRIDAPPDMLYPVRLGDSSRLKVGQRVFALGNPFGLDRTLTTGIISSLDRTIPAQNKRLKSIIQIDAAINPGNSGGPLLDTRGRVIGINTAIASKVGQSSGVGFAVPVNTIRRVVPQLIARGRVVRPDLGIEVVHQTSAGMRIARLTPKGPAERAGLRGPAVTRRQRGPLVYERVDRSAADMIVAVDDEPVTDVDTLLDLVERKQPGDVIELTVIREGKQQVKVPVRLGSTE